MIGGIVAKRFQNVQVDVFPDGDLVVYEAEGKVTKVYETTQ